MTSGDGSGSTGRIRRSVAAAMLVCVGLAGGVLLGRTSTPDQAAAQREPVPRTPVLAEVVEQRLMDVRTGSCELSVSSSAVVVPQGVDGGVVTAVHVRPGADIEPGMRVIDVSGRPLIALALPFPMYRTIAPFDEGPDVEAVQSALAAIGLYGGEPNGLHDAASQRAVRSLYDSVGAPVPNAGPEAAARAADAEQTIDELNAQLRSGGVVGQAEIDRALAERSAARRALGVPVPFGDLLSRPSGQISKVAVKVGSAAAAGDTIATISARAASVRCTLPVGGAADLTPGMAATVKVEGADRFDGALSALEPDENGSLVGEFTATTEIPGLLAGQSGTLEVTVAASAEEVLTIPASALRSGPSGTQVEVVDGQARRPVPIETGLVASGWVEVTGGKLSAGDHVVVIGSAS